MTLPGLDDTQLAEHGAQRMAREITAQPQAWDRVFASVQRSQQVERLLASHNLRILLTGAGASAYIGECLAPAILRRTDRRVEAVPTTDLVSGPRRYFQRSVPTLMVSFAREADSPESVAAMRMADEFIDDCYHLVLSCSEDGDLCRLARSCSNAEVIVLPSESQDGRCAMASSFTSLLLAAARIFDVVDMPAPPHRPACIVGAQDVLSRGIERAQALAREGCERVIYVGSNELKGLAREGALQLLELTEGRVVASFDSSLGFRHGPKTIINDRTLIVLFVSNDPYTRLYDLDLLQDLRSEGRAGRVFALSASAAGLDTAQGDFVVQGLEGANDIETALPFAVFAQSLAMFQSLRLGLKPDDPGAGEAAHRAVRGLKIHPPQL